MEDERGSTRLDPLGNLGLREAMDLS